MRNPIIPASLKTLLSGPKWAASRPDVLRREALFFNTVLILVAVAIAYPVALFFLVTGSLMPVMVVTLAAVLSGLALMLHLRRNFEGELLCQALTIAGIGAILTLADPDLIDFGLAGILMATLMVLLVSQSRHKHLAWVLPVMGFALGAAGHTGVLANPFAESGQDAGFIAITFYATAIFIVAVTGNRLNTMASASARTQMKTFALLVESVKDAVVRYGRDGEILFLSKSARKLFGCRQFELAGSGLFERIHVLDRPGYMAALSDASMRGIHATLDIRMRRDTDEPGAPTQYVWIELSLSPVIDSPGNDTRWEVIGVLRDVSARKDSETALNQARVEAEQASEAKSRFLATIGHELRTPLNAIVGFSDMIKAGIGGTASPVHSEYAGLIRQSGQHLLEVVNMLLDMSKIEAGKFEVHTELFAPAGLAEPCLQMVEQAAQDRKIKVIAAVPTTLPQIVGDERACRQVLINLLSNAIKFSHEGGTVRLAMKRQGRMLSMAVSDAGIGMEAGIIERVGEPFLQAQDGLSRRYEGTGLGLSIVKGLVSLHEGQLHITSEAGQGTTVTVLLPIDGPARGSPPSATIEKLHKDNTGSDEIKWLEDEKRSAAL